MPKAIGTKFDVPMPDNQNVYEVFYEVSGCYLIQCLIYFPFHSEDALGNKLIPHKERKTGIIKVSNIYMYKSSQQRNKLCSLLHCGVEVRVLILGKYTSV